MAKVSRGLLALYIATLLWLVLFKLSFHPSSVLNHHHRSLNLVPFAGHRGEMILNCVFFIPFGLLLSVNFKKTGFLAKITGIFLFSLTAEAIQFIFAIGATDITDVITNTAGGFLGLMGYASGSTFIHQDKWDRIIVFVGGFLLLLLIAMHVRHGLLR